MSTDPSASGIRLASPRISSVVTPLLPPPPPAPAARPAAGRGLTGSQHHVDRAVRRHAPDPGEVARHVVGAVRPEPAPDAEPRRVPRGRVPAGVAPQFGQ